MAERIGKYTLKFGSRPGIIASASIVGSTDLSAGTSMKL